MEFFDTPAGFRYWPLVALVTAIIIIIIIIII
jgi:hypothetical protein